MVVVDTASTVGLFKIMARRKCVVMVINDFKILYSYYYYFWTKLLLKRKNVVIFLSGCLERKDGVCGAMGLVAGEVVVVVVMVCCCWSIHDRINQRGHCWWFGILCRVVLWWKSMIYGCPWVEYSVVGGRTGRNFPPPSLRSALLVFTSAPCSGTW